MLDGHHLVENRARVRAGWLFNFSGTGGIWRKEAIAQRRRLAARHAHRGSRPLLPRAARRVALRLPRERRDPGRAARGHQRLSRAAVPLGQGDRADRPQAAGARDARAELTPMQRIEAFFHLTPHFAYPLMVFLSVLLLPALVLMPATNPRTMLLIDLPLVHRDDGLARGVLHDGRGPRRADRRIDALRSCRRCSRSAPGWRRTCRRPSGRACGSMAGEFVRTPKKGIAPGPLPRRGRPADASRSRSASSRRASTVASLETGHWFATPFAMLFTSGYGYVAPSSSRPSSWPGERRSSARRRRRRGASRRQRASPPASGPGGTGDGDQAPAEPWASSPPRHAAFQRPNERSS